MMKLAVVIGVLFTFVACTCQKQDQSKPQSQAETAPKETKPSDKTPDASLAKPDGKQPFPILDYLKEDRIKEALKKDTVSKFNLTLGTGNPFDVKKQITVHYEGWLDEGTKFDSTYDRQTSTTFLSGADRIIKGIEFGLEGMREGGTRLIVVPSKFGYGPQGIKGRIPKNSPLLYHLKLVAVK